MHHRNSAQFLSKDGCAYGSWASALSWTHTLCAWERERLLSTDTYLIARFADKVHHLRLSARAEATKAIFRRGSSSPGSRKDREPRPRRVWVGVLRGRSLVRWSRTPLFLLLIYIPTVSPRTPFSGLVFLPFRPATVSPFFPLERRHAPSKMILAGRCRAAACGGARVLKPRSMLQSRRLSPSTTSKSQHQGAPAAQAKVDRVAYQARPVVSGERVRRLTLALVSATAIAAGLGLADGSSSRPAAVSGMSSWSAQETAAFLATLGEAVGEEHVSTDEGE